ncbi:MAG: cation diffusion facilitator family transporter [Acidobacteriaceae bacterium]
MSEPAAQSSSLRIAFSVTIAILAAEIIGGVAAHSLALLADAAHMATDAVATGLAWWAARVALRPADHRNTFGYGRATVLAALFNAAALFAAILLIGIEAVHRLQSPSGVTPSIMIAVAAFALVANLVLSVYLVRTGGDSLNIRGVVLHLIGDGIISAAVILAAIGIAYTGILQLDPIVSLGATIVVAFSAWSLVREAIAVLMESVPASIDLAKVRARVTKMHPMIYDIHDLHVWSLTDGHIAASFHLHVGMEMLSHAQELVREIKSDLAKTFAIVHATIEVECNDCQDACS